MLTAPPLTPAAVMSHPAVLNAREEQALASASRLYALRRRINADSAATDVPTVYVVLYALTDPGVSPREHLAEPQGLALAHGYLVRARFCDIADGIRSGWAKAQRAIAEGHAHGIVASSCTAVGGSDQQYELELHWLARHRAALWLVRPEPAL
ncbi:hypothetical protein [Streptomyces sp. ALI-76-A]|uniref:hypothetical protein n=1 Tax=Streptomyces sp. ALI-76-A TaxID=3025736 RepID=UPI00256EBD5A|nr:hypothetical protein [Streptomyces sp. ALI-76-A]MDL5199755.1 hypothetical protein [Streptomyces sp. ALI-76-A]